MVETGHGCGNGGFICAYHFADIIAPQITLEGDFQAITGKSYEGVLEPGPLTVPMLYLRHLEVASVALAAAATFILLAGFRKAQRWAALVGLLWLLAGLLIPVKTFFPRKA